MPPNRSRLYRTALDILLEDWSAERQLNRDPIYEDFHPELETVMLSEIAVDYFRQDRLFFSENSLLEKTRAFLTKSLKASETLDAKAVLKAIEEQQGIFVERSEQIYSFSHLTIQEYLTARHIAKDFKQVKNLVQEQLFEDRWQEIFWLVAGEEDYADPILELMWQRLQQEQLTDTPLLQDLLCWSKSISLKAEANTDTFEIEAYVIRLAINFANNICTPALLQITFPVPTALLIPVPTTLSVLVPTTLPVPAISKVLPGLSRPAPVLARLPMLAPSISPTISIALVLIPLISSAPLSLVLVEISILPVP